MGIPGAWSVLLLSLLQGWSCWAQEQKPPHIVFILADDLGWNYVPWHNESVYAPNLMELATTGVLLEQSYVQPLCSPSRSAFMTGMYPYHLGRQHYVIIPQQPSGVPLNYTFLPETLKTLGYDTHIVGKWHMGFCNESYTPLHRGFDTQYGFYTGKTDYYNHTNCAYLVDNVTHSCYGYDFRDQGEVAPDANGTYSTYLYTERALSIIHDHSGMDTPMFLYLPHQNAHDPCEVPDEFANLYPEVEDLNTRITLGMVSALDSSVGRVIAALRETGMYDNTLIIFSSDNGGPSGPMKDTNIPLRGHKSQLWEGGTRGAGFVHSPLLSNTPRTYNGLMHITDWHNTLLAVAGMQQLPANDGFNQWEVIRTGDGDSPRDKMIYNIDEMGEDGYEGELYAAIRVGDFKYVTGEHKKGPDHETGPYLFNIKDDPYENHNLMSTNSSLGEQLKQMILDEFATLMPADNPPDSLEGNPHNWDGVWSPGWCNAWP